MSLFFCCTNENLQDFFIPAAPKVGRLREEIGNLKKEAENYRTTGLEKLKYRLLGDELWDEPSQKARESH